MYIHELRVKFPLEADINNYFIQKLSIMKEVISEKFESQYGIQCPENALSDSALMFFCLSIGIEGILYMVTEAASAAQSPHFRSFSPVFADMVKNSFAAQIKIFEKDLMTTVAHQSLNRGVPFNTLLEYTCLYYENAHKKVFPNQPFALEVLYQVKLPWTENIGSPNV